MFECTTKDYAAALNAVVAPNSGSRMECGGLVELVALRALQDALGDKRFNQLLTVRLGTAPLTLCRLSPQISQSEVLTADSSGMSYAGDRVFRPGDMVAFGNDRRPARGGIWAVENAICVGWRADAKGQPRFRDPLFVGGGVKGAKSEAQMRECIFQESKDENVQGKRKAHFSEKAIGGPKCIHRLDTRVEALIARREDRMRAQAKGGELSARQQAQLEARERRLMKTAVPDIFLHTTVTRVSALGGRRDVF